MKAKTISCLSVCCAVSMFVASAYANTTTNWFGMAATDATLNLTNATTNGAPIEVTGSVIELENDADTKLVVAPTVGSEPAVSDGLVKIKSTSRITPCPYSELSAADVSGAKAGFTVAYNGAVTNFYGYASGYANGSWFALSGAVPGDGATTFTIALDYRTHKASFYVGDTVLSNNNNVTAFAFDGGTTLTNIAVYGTGTIGSIATDCEVAVADYNGVKYGSVADAIAAASSAGGTEVEKQERIDGIKYVDAGGATVDKTTADNGLPVAVCVAVGLDPNNENAKVEVEPVTNDTAPGAVTLKLATTVDPNVEITYTIAKQGGESTTFKSSNGTVQIPTATGIYTITPSIKPAQ